MKNASFYSYFMALTFVTIGFGSFSTPASSMDSKKADTSDMEPHLTYLRKTLNEHGFHPAHFRLASEPEDVKLFDIKEHQEQRILEICKSHPKREAFEFRPSTPLSLALPTQTTSIYSTLWNMLPSMPSLWSGATPTSTSAANADESSAKGLNNPSNLTISSFYIIPTSTSENEPILSTLFSTPDLQPSSPENVSIIDNYSRRSLETEPIELGLSLKGGGGRGYMQALWLKHLMDEAKAPIWRIFPSIAGVSIGAILGLGVASPNVQVSELEAFFTTDFDQVFPTDNYWNFPVRIWDSGRSLFYPQYDAGPLETLLQKRIGDLTMNQTLTDVVATAVDKVTKEAHVFNRDQNGQLPVWQVARASSAAPTFFKAFDINGVPYIDGGLGENNPVLRLLLRMRELSQQRNQSFTLDKVTILSLGTGDMPTGQIPSEAGLLSAASIIGTCMDVQSNAAEMTAKSLVPNFVSINPKLSKVIPLNILNDEIRELLRAAAETKYEEIEKFAHLDVVRRQLERTQY